MSKPTTKTTIMDNGLRYQSKPGGSPFASVTGSTSSSMSCFLCGTHRVRSTMTTRKIIGKSQVVCAPSCAAAKLADAAAR